MLNDTKKRRTSAIGERGPGRAPKRVATESWTLREAATELTAQSMRVISLDSWISYLREQIKAGTLQTTDKEVLADDVNALLDAHPRWGRSTPRLPSARQTDVRTVVGLDYSMHAPEWFDMAAISPREAASLLCQHDPLDVNADPENVTNLETGPDDFRLLLRVFEDVHQSATKCRTLIEWITIAKARTCKHHSWISRYLEARERLGFPVVPTNDLVPDKAAPAKPLQRTAAQVAAILCEIKKQGYDPMALPKNPDGKPGVKAAIRSELSKNALFRGLTVFDKAWERMTARGDIGIKG